MKSVVIVTASGGHSLEISGPGDVFAEAMEQAPGRVEYQMRVIAIDPGPIICASGLRISPDRTIHDPDEPIDTLIVVGPHAVPRPPADPALLAWLRRRTPTIRRFGSVCTGAFLLGEAGLLDGKRVTTHWAYEADLMAAYPLAIVEKDRIFVRDGALFSSAGVTACIDLALALVEEDHGRPLALAVARHMVMFLKRSGGQPQFSVQLAAQIASRSPIEHSQEWIRNNPAADLSVHRLASQAGMSDRNFSRVFHKEAGMTPADFVEATRVDVARRSLEETTIPLQTIAKSCGFAGTDAMRRVFLRHLGVGPGAYRQRSRFSETYDVGHSVKAHPVSRDGTA
jgi:transcriptional regulator GlxA family with amidase domain